VIFQINGDIFRAESIVRISLRIRAQLYDNEHPFVGEISLLLAHILKIQGKLGDKVFIYTSALLQLLLSIKD
jgi:hypothetical protein